tara:strand:- start:7625 stop:11023 length:3399 start_codon:yes stop_codon:yes gene_type:complete
MVQFVHLHCHSEFSILESSNRIKDLIAKAVEYNMSALALTDNATMYGAIDFYQKAKQAAINPILGVDIYLAKDITQKERWQHRMVLLAKSYKGYQNIIKLVSKAHLEGMYYKPRLDLATLSLFSDDLIVISPGGRGPVASYIQEHQDELALEFAISLKDVFGDNFYLGAQRVGGAHEEMVEIASLEIAKKLDVPMVAMNNVYTLLREDALLRDILFSIQTGKVMDDMSRAKFQNNELFFKSSQDMATVFHDHPDWLENTVVIADQCQIDIEMEQVLLPHFHCPDNQSSEEYLEALVWKGIDRCYEERTPEIIDRVKFELSIISKMKYPNYFLIIFDFLDFCYKEGIPVGPGRGSAAGSIVSYALGITKCDPIKYKLLFERFLNPERVSMPDIDIDFCIKRRNEVIDYILQTYGQNFVSQIITFGTMQARAVVRDVGRVLDVSLADVDRIAKLIPSTPGTYVSIPDAIKQVSELNDLYESQDQFRDLLDIAIKLEGITRHTSTHAAGVVISRDPLDSVVPLTQNDGQVATQFAMADIESIGLLKMDILGLRNLTVIEDTVSLIKKDYDPDFNIDEISYEDPASFSMLLEGRGVGVFQCESKGMRQLMKDMKPDVFEDLIALLALYRPGPLGSGMVSDFISNKLGETEVSYPLPELEPILKETYGMIVYQEQVMQIASTIAGFSLGQADMLRRAMGKKKKDVMDKLRVEFLDGAKERNIAVNKANDVFDLCYKFAEYGFNKSHSAAYAMISFQTAFLKANYTVEYMASLLSSVVNNSDKTALYMQECNDLKVNVLPPDVNESKHYFTVVPIIADSGETTKGIRFGLSAIKNVGDGAIESIEENAPFKDIADFCLRVDLKQANKRVMESLIKSGAMDSFGERSYLLAIFETVMEKANITIRERRNGQVSLFADNQVGSGFSLNELSLEDYRVYSPSEKLKFEKEMLGLYISGHPLDLIKDRLMAVKTPVTSFQASDTNKIVSVTGILSGCKRIITRSKKEMLVGDLEDLTGSLTVLIFHDDTFEEKVAQFQDDHVVTVKGRLRVGTDEMSISCMDLTLHEKLDGAKSFYIDVDGLEMELLTKIKKLNGEFKGTFPVYLKIADKTIATHQKFWVVEDDLYRVQLENLIGRGRVWIA